MEAFKIHLDHAPTIETDGRPGVLIIPTELALAAQWTDLHFEPRHQRRAACGLEGGTYLTQTFRGLRLHLAGTTRTEELLDKWHRRGPGWS